MLQVGGRCSRVINLEKTKGQWKGWKLCTEWADEIRPRDLHARLWDLRRDSPSHLQAREEEEADTNEGQNHRRKTSQRCTSDLIISAYQCRREYLEIIRVPLCYVFTSRHCPPDRLLRPGDTLTVNHPPSFSKVYHLSFTCDWWTVENDLTKALIVLWHLSLKHSFLGIYGTFSCKNSEDTKRRPASNYYYLRLYSDSILPPLSPKSH